MFIKTTQFKRMLKEAYTGAGIEVYNTGDELRIGGGYWMITVKAGKINKENLAAIIEFTGNLPGTGEGFCAKKDESNQGSFKLQEIQEGAFWDELYISRINFQYGGGKGLRLLQNSDKDIFLIREELLKLIDPSKVELTEIPPSPPLLILENLVEWRNDTMALRTMTTNPDVFKEVVSALEKIPEGIV